VLDLAISIVQGRLGQDAQAQQDVLAAAVEADDGRVQDGAVQVARLVDGAVEEGGGVQLVQIERLSQLERPLLKLIVDLKLVVVDGELAWGRQCSSRA
jgi:hypothetical protein